ncbi:MAG TPA: prolyl oligopeptidase family serine peptidase [Chitinivibrionales bacterium]|nr:prolyl oligopeptidase family serine peptidase [Chitinivibrionales bacterium]
MHNGISVTRPPPSLSVRGIPPIPDSLARAVSRYRSWNFASFAGWAPGGSGMVVVSRVKQINQVLFVASPGAPAKQLTFLGEPVTNVAVCPDSSRRMLLFTKDSGGDENFQIYSLSFGERSPARITSGAAQNEGIVWSNAGDRFAFHSNRRNGRDFGIYLCDIRNSGSVRPLVEATGSWSAVDWSPGDSLLLLLHYLSRTASYLYACNLKTGACAPLHDTLDTVSQEIGAWGPDGRGIFLTSDERTDFRTLRYFDVASRRETVLSASIPWDVREIEMSRDRSRLAFQTNQHGYSHVYIMNTATFAYREVPGLPRGGIYGLKFDPSGERLGMTITTARQPEEAFSLRLSDFSLVRWTASGLGGLDSNALVTPELVEYPTFDSAGGVTRTVPCFVYKPKNKRGPFPVLIDVHGGPESQFWPYFKPDLQYDVCDLGLCVLAPNIRGSGGYGKEWLSLDNGYRREDAVKDVGALLDWVATRPDLDASAVAISGGSYGGYVALASLIRYGNGLTAGIDRYGICNFVTFLERTAPYRRDLRRAEYGDERDTAMRAFLLRISPLTGATRIRCPLFIFQGANDPRVPLYESEQMAGAVRANGGVVWSIVAKDEGHGIRRKANQDYLDFAEAMFLKMFLLEKRKKQQ